MGFLQHQQYHLSFSRVPQEGEGDENLILVA